MEQDPTPTTMLRALHESYICAVNEAVADGDLPRIDQLVDEFDREAMAIMVASQPPAA